jgi:hypothetical protein
MDDVICQGSGVCNRGSAPERELELAADVRGTQQVAVVEEVRAAPALGAVGLVPRAPDVEEGHEVALRRRKPGQRAHKRLAMGAEARREERHQVAFRRYTLHCIRTTG